MRRPARKLRKRQTEAERRLWQRLRNRRLGGYKFRRQHPIGRFIVDFGCLEKRLVVEVDGGQHSWRVEDDALRTSKLEASGFMALRFWNNDVLGRMDEILGAIHAKLEER